MSSKVLRGLRGATTVSSDSSPALLEATAELLTALQRAATELKHIYLHGAAAPRSDRGS